MQISLNPWDVTAQGIKAAPIYGYNMKFKPFHVLIAYLTAEILAFTFFMPFVYNIGTTDHNILLYFVLAYSTACVFFGLSKKIPTKQAITSAFILRIITVTILAFLVNKINLPFLGLITGISLFLFWAPFNYTYFLAMKEGNATGSWKYAFLGSMLNVILPIISGLISIYTGLRYLFLISIPIYIVGVYIASKTEWKPLDYSLSNALKRYSGLRTLAFLEGFWQPLYFIGIPLITATYLRNNMHYGEFFAFLGITSGLASYVMAKYSDRTQKRKSFVYTIAFLLALTSILVTFHKEFWQWQILAGAMYFLQPMAVTFFLAMILDKKDKRILRECIVAREYILNLGRAFGALVIIFFWLYSNILYSFLVLGMAMLIYPFFVKLKKIYPAETANVPD